eukprot:m.62981 g.62981  ORF g.62981 m.62981 type:complete len:728 (-) comp13823_c0_seq1:412-2595(-)
MKTRHLVFNNLDLTLAKLNEGEFHLKNDSQKPLPCDTFATTASPRSSPALTRVCQRGVVHTLRRRPNPQTPLPSLTQNRSSAHWNAPVSVLQSMARPSSCVGALLGVALAMLLWLVLGELLLSTSTAALPHPAAADGGAAAEIGAGRDRLKWLMQISDLHISEHGDEDGRLRDLHALINTTLPLVKPALLIVSGDMTDAKDRRALTTAQRASEWRMYAAALNASSVPVVDLRGNHDAFNVLDPFSETDLYTAHGASKKHGHHTIRLGDLAIVVLDATPKPGPRAPFNAFGHLTSASLEDFAAELRAAAQYARHIVVASHYPSGIVVSPRSGDVSFKALLRQYASLYVCGHLHTLFDMVRPMHANSPTGLLEMELADWKLHRAVRVIAVDHDLLSVGDFEHGDWPWVLVTNPKSAQQLLSDKEPWWQMANSSHIRLLAWSPAGIERVRVVLNSNSNNKVSADEGVIECTKHAEETALWLCPWDARALSAKLTGVQTMKVVVTDTAGVQTTRTHQFSLDGSWAAMPLLASIVLQVDFQLLLLCSAVATTALTLAALLLPLSALRSITPPFIHRLIATWRAGRSLMQRLLTLYVLYLLLGPWFVGRMLDSAWGSLHSFGVLVLQPATHQLSLFPTPYGQFHLALRLVLGVWPLAIVAHTTTTATANTSSFCQTSWWRIVGIVWLAVSCVVVVLFWISMWVPYGPAALIANPSNVFFFVLVLRAFSREPRR